MRVAEVSAGMAMVAAFGVMPTVSTSRRVEWQPIAHLESSAFEHVMISIWSEVDRSVRVGVPSWAHTGAAPRIPGRGAEEEFVTKLETISQLPDGWWGPGSRRVSDELIAIAREASPMLHRLAPMIAVAPYPDGSLVLEWSRGTVEYTAELSLSGTTTVTSDDTETDELDQRSVPTSARALVEAVAEIMG